MSGRRRVLVWDGPVRICHWLIAALVPVLWLTERWNRMGWHVLAGTVLLGVVLFRLAWGVLGSDTARFTRFLTRPGTALHHLRGLLTPAPDEEVGHNPAGGWMVVVLLALLLTECLSGVFVNNDVADQGPLTDLFPASVLNLVTDLHTILFQILIAAVALHLTAIAVYALVRGQNLVWPMIVGRKWLAGTTPAPQIAGWRRALLLAVATAGAAWLIGQYS